MYLRVWGKNIKRGNRRTPPKAREGSHQFVVTMKGGESRQVGGKGERAIQNENNALQEDQMRTRTRTKKEGQKVLKLNDEHERW